MGIRFIYTPVAPLGLCWFISAFIVVNDMLMPQSNESNFLIEEVSDMKFTAVYKKVPEGYIGFVQELPGANTQGKTLEETRANLQEAIEMTLEANRILAKESPLKSLPYTCRPSGA